MKVTRITTWLITGVVLSIPWSSATVFADLFRIDQIQYVDLSVDPSGASSYDGQTHDCIGGIVTTIWTGSRPRLVLQDPNYMNGWGAIQVKGWNGGDTFAGINPGDWVSFTDVLVEEYRGNTFLQFGGTQGPAPNAAFARESTGHTIPASTVVTLDQIAAPAEGPPESWLVADHSAEPYEAMWLTVKEVTVTGLGFGKADDNYVLSSADGDAWASDYNNEGKGYFDLYHPYVQLGSEFYSVTGILEQYEKGSTDDWDYYQLLTTSTGDLNLVPEPSAWLLLLSGVLSLAGWPLIRRRRS